MTDSQGWARGYPVVEPYPPAWHGFQSPAHLSLACALRGVTWEVEPGAPLSICDVGCGTGYTAAVLAASSPEWQVVGLDYNPAHVAEARSMATAAGLSNLRVLETDLAAMDDAALDALPEFDLVTVHGLWSWVADPVREGVLRLLRRRLKPGGIALVSYNALPGASGALGLSRLVRSAMVGARGSEQAAEAARGLVRQLVVAEARHLPQSSWRSLLLGERGQPARPGYLLHEFLTEHWRPAFHADVAAAMASARCEFLGSATLDENLPQWTLSPEQQALWAAAPDEPARQLLIDLCVPRPFRRDIFVRGLRPAPRDAAIERVVLALASHATDEVKLMTQAGEAVLPALLMNAVRGTLAQGPRSIAELRALPGCGGVTPAEMLVMLTGTRVAVPLWRRPSGDAGWAAAAAASRRLNAVAAARQAPHGTGAGMKALASPALGGGLAVESLELAVASLCTGKGKTAPDPAGLAKRLVPPCGEPPAEILAGLEENIAALLRERLPVWHALGILSSE